MPPPSPVPTRVSPEDVTHILLIGGDTDYVLDMNTDVMIVVAVNRATRQVSMISIPRDLWVYIPTYGWSRINVAHRIGARGKYPGGGPALLARTINETLGIPIDHWVRISHKGFAGVVDELGGVDMIVPCGINLRYKPPTSEEEQEMWLTPGVYHMDGDTALRYVRTRRGTTDFDRSRRQQQFLKAVWNQFKSADLLPRIPGLWAALSDSFKTDLNLGDILALAPTALDLQPERIRSLYIGYNQLEPYTTPEGWRVQLPIPERVAQVVSRLYSTGSAQDAVANEKARVLLWNGTAQPQLALIAADDLSWQGLKIVETGPADRTDYARTQVTVYSEKPAALAMIVDRLGVRENQVIYQLDPNAEVDFEIILGQDYDPCR
jgi:LCP family protein required for cell wall assembly